MKKILQLFFAAAFLFVGSQGVMAQIRYGAKAGVNFAKVNYRQYPGLLPKMTLSYQVGGVAEITLPTDYLYANIGLEYQGKGYTYVTDTTDYSLSQTVTPFYIQIPVDVIVRGDNGGMYGGIGVYMAYGVTGKVKQTEKFFSEGRETTTEDNVRFGTDINDHFRPLDFGAQLVLGYDTQIGLRISGSYSWGFGDARKDTYKETRIISPVNHRVASLCLSYFFSAAE